MRNLGFTAHIACCAILIALSAAPAAAQSGEAERTLRRAAQLHEAGDLEGAVREYKAFLVLKPNVVEVRSNLGAALARLGRYEEAIEQYQQAIGLDARNTQVRFNLAVAHYKAAQFEEAATQFARVVAEDRSNKNALMLLADCHLRAGAYKKVIDLLEPAIAADPENSTVAYMLGTAYISEDQPEKGQVLIDRILRNGESAEAHVLMGSVRLSRDSAAAVKEFERAIELNPNLPLVHSLYGKALLGTGDRERGLVAFQEELKRNPNDFDANIYVGRLLKEEQKYVEAIAYLEKALMVRPRDPGASYFIAGVKIALGKVVEAQTLLEGVVKQAPEFLEAHVLLATAYYRLKLKENGDRERLIIQKLNAERQAAAPGARDGLGPAYRGEQSPDVQPIRKPESKPPN